MSKRAKRSLKVTTREDRNQFHQQQKPLSHHQFQRDPAQELERPTIRRRRVDLIPRNVAQERYVKSLIDQEQSIVFAMGPAGCGKTLLATQYAIKAMQEGTYDRVVITRPAVSVDEQHGFLPGTLIEKVAPWCRPVLDVFKEYYDLKTIERMMEDETIELAPLAYMRGRTFKRCLIIFDESQNATPSQMKMLLTRIGDGSKIVVTGDINQHDRGFEENGLKDFIGRIETRGNASMPVIRFGESDVERHPVIEEVLRLYKDD